MTGADDPQQDVLRFLDDPRSWVPEPERVERKETHGAIVFLAGDTALKIKRAVRLAYLDFSTLEARRQVCEREIEINRPNAPDIYLGTVAITREATGRLAIGGRGEPVEWAVRMRRFDERDVLVNVVASRHLAAAEARALAGAIAAMHGRATRHRDAADPMPGLLELLSSALAGAAGAPAFLASLSHAVAASEAVRRLRSAAGHVRRCHGDLHLGNIVLWNGAPTVFDAIEFDERLATIDTLYDLAFVLMDLVRHDARAAATVVLNQYLHETGDPDDLVGLAMLPAFLAARAGIRAMVALDRARVGAADAGELARHVARTLALGTELARPPPPRLVAVGGLSGSGKTTLAATLAPWFGATPGALHLRSDLERKRLAGARELERLPASAYTRGASAAVYARLLERTEMALRAGHSVVVDAVFADPQERAAIRNVASAAHVPFQGLWLEAPAQDLCTRVERRRGDASDATPEVVARQLAYDLGQLDWVRIDAAGEPVAVAHAAAGLLAIVPRR